MTLDELQRLVRGLDSRAVLRMGKHTQGPFYASARIGPQLFTGYSASSLSEATAALHSRLLEFKRIGR